MAVKPIALSFKNTPEDIELYKWIISHSNMSGFIKDILREKMNGETKEYVSEKMENRSNNLIELDF